jgi:hypothetical protein
MNRLRAPAFAAARASNELTIRACARRDRARVGGEMKPLRQDPRGKTSLQILRCKYFAV